MDVKAILMAGLSAAGMEKLRSLDFPEQGKLKKLGVKELTNVCEHARRVLAEIVLEGKEPELKEVKRADGTTWGRRAIRDCALAVMGLQYDAAVRELILRGVVEGDVVVPPGIKVKEIEEFEDRGKTIEGGAELDEYRGVLHSYFGFLLSTYIFSLGPGSRMPGYYATGLESAAHADLARMQRVSARISLSMEDGQFYGRWFCSLLVSGATELAAEVYSRQIRPGTRWKGVHSLVDTGELVSLANRDELACRKYGAKAVESVFERQLALTFESLGFSVVPGQKGERVVDLICLSLGAEPYSFLVEAKSSKKPYRLPTKDERALKEYVAGTKRTLMGCPELGFVLIVGGEASDGLTGRLTGVSNEAGLPYRYISAAELADMREGIVGPLRGDIFKEEVLRCNGVVGSGAVARVVKRYEKEKRAHGEYVRSMLEVGGMLQGAIRPGMAAGGKRARGSGLKGVARRYRSGTK